jgi:peptidoglycan hydrolase-like protein with peptidoglycan-binding domain
MATLFESQMAAGRIIVRKAPWVVLGVALVASCQQVPKPATNASPVSEQQDDRKLTTTQGDSVDKKKERAEYAAELDKLKRDDPAKYERSKKVFTLGLQMLLGEAGYGIGPYDGVMDAKTESALRAYQKDNGLTVNGDVLDMDLLDKLTQQQKDLRAPVSLPPKFALFDNGWDEGFVQASGTWVSLNDKIGIPLQTSKITCIRSQKQCIESRAQLHSDVLDVSTEFYDIERWDKSEIVTKPSDAICVRSVMRLNRLQKSVTAIDSKISDKGLCKDVPDKDINSELQDGFPVYWNLQREYLQKRNRIFKLSPDALSLLNSDAVKK